MDNKGHNVGERVKVLNGPFEGRHATLLGFKSYRSIRDLVLQKKSDDEQLARPIGQKAMGWCPDTGRVYEARFDDGTVTKILDTELI